MDPQPNGGSPSSSSGSCQRNKAHKRPWDSDGDPPSLGSSETSSHPPTQPGSPEPSASAGGATFSEITSSLEEFCRTLGKDYRAHSASSDEDSPFADDWADSEMSDEYPPFSEACTESEGSSDDPVTSDSESSTEDSANPRKSSCRGKQAGPISLSTMKNINGRFIDETLDLRLPCTANEGTTCQIVDHLSAWNEFLCLASWQLQETSGTSGKLSLVFFREPSRKYTPPQHAHLVALLACQLLKIHRCVAHVEFHISLFKSHHEILSDALRGSPSITSVKLVFSSWNSGEDLATAALSLPHLKELEYAGFAQYSATLVARLSTFLQTTTSLTALGVSQLCPRGLSTEDFFRVLGQNCSLQELVLPSRLIASAPPSAQAVCTEWLTNSVSLKSLTLTSLIRVCVPLKCILEGLLGNRSIVAICFQCPEIDQADIQLMSKVFEQNKVLRSFKISYESQKHSTMSSFVQGCPDKADCDRCLKALLENHSLEEVALPIDIWDEDQWKELFEALPAKNNLKRVSIEAIGGAPRHIVAKLCAALKETGADQKVSFNASCSEVKFDEALMCKAFRNVIVHASEHNKAAVHGILEGMPSLGHIACLELYFDMKCDPDGVLSSALATFLGATRTLKTLTLTGSLDTVLYDCQEALMKGLAGNTSLREVQIDVGTSRSDFSVFSEPLADVINASKNISRVYLGVRGPDCGERAFFRRLSAGIADNYVLLSVTVFGYRYRKFKRYWFKVWDTTRRNCGLLTGAADFARGARRDRRCSLALERVHGHPELVEEVDQARAAAMVRDGLRSIEGMHQFMRLAGVVKERVLCNESPDGSTQLDALNEHCWRALRQYLKLYDIRDSTEGVPAQ